MSLHKSGLLLFIYLLFSLNIKPLRHSLALAFVWGWQYDLHTWKCQIYKSPLSYTKYIYFVLLIDKSQIQKFIFFWQDTFLYNAAEMLHDCLAPRNHSHCQSVSRSACVATWEYEVQINISDMSELFFVQCKSKNPDMSEYSFYNVKVKIRTCPNIVFTMQK